MNEVEEELEGAVGRVALIWEYGEERRREDVVRSECECEKGERRRKKEGERKKKSERS